MQTYEGLRASGLQQRSSVQALQACRAPAATARVALRVVADKKVRKVQEVIVTKNTPGLGRVGDIKKVPLGYYRNYLMPRAVVTPMTDGIIENLKRAEESKQKAAQEVKAKAQAMATALQTIGKFVIRKKVAEGDQLYGSVSADDVLEAIEQQTGRRLDGKALRLPAIDKVGAYEAQIQLHPEVTGTFTVVVQRQKEQQRK